LRADLIFVLAAPFNRHARRQGNFLRDARLRFADETGEVAALDVRLHKHAQTAVFTRDFAGTNLARYFGDRIERNIAAIADRNRKVAQPLNVIAFAALDAHLNRNALAALNRGRDILAADAG